MSAKIEDQISKIRQAISTLETQRSVLGNAVVDASIAALQKQLEELEEKSGYPEQQRKLVTLLFADVVNSTRLAQHMEPDEVSEIMDSALQHMAGPVPKHGGHVTRFMGDGFKAVFGLPVARENDPERAIRAGLEILKETQAVARRLAEERGISSFQVRVGINTGLVVAGGTTEAEDTIMGAAVNMAARLESAAPPGGILISRDTYQHVRGLFEVEPLQSITVKGFDDPVQVYLVKGEKPRSFKAQNRGVEGIETRMIGREAELKRLQDLFQLVAEDHICQMATIIGDAGVGKSRLLDEFKCWLDQSTEPVELFKGRSIEEAQNQPYALMRAAFATRFDIQDNDPRDVVREKFEEGIFEAFEGKSILPISTRESSVMDTRSRYQIRAHFIGQLLGFDFSQSQFLSGVLNDARQLRDRGLLYLLEYYKAITDKRLAVIFLEDIHWADDISLDLISNLAQGLQNSGLLIVSLTRPSLFEHRPLWGEGQDFHTKISLTPLSTRECRRLVVEILQKMDEVPLSLRELVVAGSEGNPFYIEELIKMLIENGVITVSEDHWEVQPKLLSEILADMTVPATLTGVLQARLDSLSPVERTILQQASVAGRIFWDQLVEHLASIAEAIPGEDTIAALEGLRKKEMIFHRESSTFSGAQEYIFKHALLRDVVYDSIVRRIRQEYHALVADWLIQERGDRIDEFTGMIGKHLEQAGDKSRAVVFLRKAGEQAASKYANEEALEFLNQALRLVDDGEQEERFWILLSREGIFSLQGARQSQEADLVTLIKLADSLDDGRKRGEVHLLQAFHASERSDYSETIEHAREAIRLGQSSESPHLESRGHLLWGRALLSKGDYPAAKANFEKSLNLAQRAELTALEADSLRNLGIVDERLGYQPRAIDYFERALRLYRQIGDRRGEGQVLNNLGNILLLQGDQEGGREYYEQFLNISKEIGDRWGEGRVIRNIADVYLDQADFRDARNYFEKALQITREIGNRTIESSALVGLGNVYLEQSDYARAKANFEQSLEIAREIGNRPWEAKTLSQIGRFFHRQGDYLRARSYYEQSLQIYQELGNQIGQAQVLVDVGLLDHHLGDDEGSLEVSLQALRIAEMLNHPKNQGLALNQLGRSYEGLGKTSEAISFYQKSYDLFVKLDQRNLAMEALAGLARLSLAEGEKLKALDQVGEILKYLETVSNSPGLSDEMGMGASSDPQNRIMQGLEGASDPMTVYLTCYQVLKAAGDGRARELLAEMYRAIQEQASNIEDIDLHHSFLQNIAANKEIQSEVELSGLGMDVFQNTSNS